MDKDQAASSLTMERHLLFARICLVSMSLLGKEGCSLHMWLWIGPGPDGDWDAAIYSHIISRGTCAGDTLHSPDCFRLSTDIIVLELFHRVTRIRFCDDYPVLGNEN